MLFYLESDFQKESMEAASLEWWPNEPKLSPVDGYGSPFQGKTGKLGRRKEEYSVGESPVLAAF